MIQDAHISLNRFNMKVTIITVCKNAQATIETTIKSVLSQDYKNIEYIIIDGKSTDKTVDIINQYKNKISTFISEKDDGIYYAMNEGIEQSTGDILYFLNSGDQLFSNNTILNIVKVFKKNNADFVYGDIALCEVDNPKKLIVRRQNSVSNYFLAHDTIYHQSIFVKKGIFEKYGKFLTKYKLAADYEWVLRLYIKYKIPFLHVNQIVARYLRGGRSSNEIVNFNERLSIILMYFNKYQVFFNSLLFWVVYRVVNKIKREWLLKG